MFDAAAVAIPNEHGADGSLPRPMMLGADAIPEKWLAELEQCAEIEAVACDLFKRFEDTDAWWNRYPGYYEERNLLL
jgi:hypothetical protein